MSIIDDIQSGDAEITGATIEPTETLVAQTREAVQRMRAKDAGEEQVFGSIRVTGPTCSFHRAPTDSATPR